MTSGNIYIMSGEQLTTKELNKAPETESSKRYSARVNINNLFAKLREEKNKQKKENYIFLALVCGVVAVTGIIASL